MKTKTRKQIEKKTTVWIFQTTNCWNCIWEDMNMVKKREILLTTAQNNAIRTNYIQAKIDYT